ncbi:hypothetical protein BJ878DRAFT_240758 [Calycina marina]|uniref:ARID domain-containing protein n=1 Tax=Calycina marina TaxID=1763456 RepID=A0A9P8CBS9_9HELO|nr:hypothetical protein BJ878DRAFT_240758 [Calycina marina]
MAPAHIPNTAEYAAQRQDFLRKVQSYHQKRGTHFDAEPRVGAKTVDLFYLWNTILELGGYDKVSDEKLLWRKVGEKFNLGQNHLPALAFQLKTVYYKNLAAYEIFTIHGREPPPREILEDQTARGGNLLTRTMDNYRPAPHKAIDLQPGTVEGSDASGDDGTPARDNRLGSEETPGSGGRTARGLRQAPPQRVLFQPDMQSSRARPPTTTNPMMQPTNQQMTPRGASSSYNPNHNMENISMAVSSYEPRPQMPLTLRPVITPGNNAVEFARRQRAISATVGNAGKPVSNAPRVMLPGTGFDGPNIYVRCLCALKSGIRSEQDYALHHLVKISMERGDKYRFESFAGLAEALIEKVLEVGSLFYDVDWQVEYMPDGPLAPNELDGLRGTTNILEKIANLMPLSLDDNIHSEEFSDALLQINEAALTIRNMVMLEENAAYISEICPLRDFLCIALNLPEVDSVTELKHYALEIAEQLTKYMPFNRTDPLYKSLLGQLQSEDRGAILTSLRALTRISMNLEATNQLTGVPVVGVQNIVNWLLLNDEDMVHACLDFLYQYTAVVENVDFLLSSKLNLEPLVSQLTRLLTHGVKTVDNGQFRGQPQRSPAPTHLADAPQELMEELMSLAEPQRSSVWLKCMFEEDSEESITQIALWQSYQQQFMLPNTLSSQGILPAADFIKNVSTTFIDKASAQVQSGPVPKFIIKGIRYRATPITIGGDDFKSCSWIQNDGHRCNQFFLSPERMNNHVLSDHVGAAIREDGKFDNTQGTYYCHWDQCRRFHSESASSLLRLAQHLRIHLPKPDFEASKPADTTITSSHAAKKQRLSYLTPVPVVILKFQCTAVDEKGHAAGIPLSAVLVLRNLARQIPKTITDSSVSQGGSSKWVDTLFKPVERFIFEVMAHNKPLVNIVHPNLNTSSNSHQGDYLADLMNAIKQAS